MQAVRCVAAAGTGSAEFLGEPDENAFNLDPPIGFVGVSVEGRPVAGWWSGRFGVFGAR